MLRQKKIILGIFILFLSSISLLAQGIPQKGQALLQIAREVNWPSSLSEIEISVLENKALSEWLQQQAEVIRIQNKPLKIKRLRFNYQLKPSNILYVDETSPLEVFFDLVMKKVSGTPTLIVVNDFEDLLDEGAHINMFNNGSYQISSSSLQKQSISVQGALITKARPRTRDLNESTKAKKTDKEKVENTEEETEEEDSKTERQKRREERKEARNKEDKEDKEEKEEPKKSQESPPVLAKPRESLSKVQEKFISKVARARNQDENRVAILENYIRGLERTLDANKIDYQNLKEEYEEEKVKVESEIAELNLTIIEKDSLRAKDQLLAERKIKLAESEAKLSEAHARQNLYFALIIGAIAIGLSISSYIFYRDKILIKKQKNNLAENLEEIQQQKEEIEAQRDEIERQRNQVQAQQDESEKLLLNILPAQTAAELKSTGKATPQAYAETSVLFTDFKGFTEIAEALSPEELIEELNRCFVAFDEIAEKHNLERIKTIGDSYMCVGGLPAKNKTNPWDAVKAGLEIQEFMSSLAEEKKKQGKSYFECRLGIHTGKVVAGVVGKKKFAYDIWGDTVNLASRMESKGEIGKVNISDTTYQYIKDEFKCQNRGEVEVKGKGKVEMYFVESIIAEA